MLRAPADRPCSGAVSIACAMSAEGRCLMPRTAVARSPRHDSQSSMSGVDELIQRGRRQGYLSLPELRAAFGRAGVSAAEARSILRELADAGVRLGNDKPAAAGTTAATATPPQAGRDAAGQELASLDDPDPAELDAEDLGDADLDSDDLAGGTARPADADDVPAPATRRARRAAADDS